jgi:hypothetical protein
LVGATVRSKYHFGQVPSGDLAFSTDFDPDRFGVFLASPPDEADFGSGSTELA